MSKKLDRKKARKRRDGLKREKDSNPIKSDGQHSMIQNEGLVGLMLEAAGHGLSGRQIDIAVGVSLGTVSRWMHAGEKEGAEPVFTEFAQKMRKTHYEAFIARKGLIVDSGHAPTILKLTEQQFPQLIESAETRRGDAIDLKAKFAADPEKPRALSSDEIRMLMGDIMGISAAPTQTNARVIVSDNET